MCAITNCPVCHTQFVVTQEQLNNAHGKVRCGHCLHVFHAEAQLFVVDDQAENHLNLIADVPPSSDELVVDAKSYVLKSTDKKPTYLLVVCASLLLFVAIVQSIYFLRSDIATYYPNSRPFLTSVCNKIGCNIELAKKIELIVIDDSDIQEDADYAGLMHLSTTITNQAEFNQAYPNLVLTLTDAEDKPRLRRIFKPREYIPASVDVTNGMTAGEEVKLKLEMTTQGISVAGYRLFISY